MIHVVHHILIHVTCGAPSMKEAWVHELNILNVSDAVHTVKPEISVEKSFGGWSQEAF